MSTQSWRKENPEKMRAYRRTWYYRNKENACKNQKRLTAFRRKQGKELVDLHIKPCILCGEEEKCCIDFHHLDPTQKKGNISMMANQGYSEKTLLEEMAKCICICSNCHRKLHAGKVALPVGIAPT